MIGKIKCVKTKGFGYIKPDNGGADIFFHVSKVSAGTVFDNLQEGDIVEFDTGENAKGEYALDVHLKM